jgi:hypothetical protein
MQMSMACEIHLLGKGQVQKKEGLHVDGNLVFVLKTPTHGDSFCHFWLSPSKEHDGDQALFVIDQYLIQDPPQSLWQ